MAGAAAGLISDTITHPINTAKTRMQVFKAAESGKALGGVSATIKDIIRTEGWRKLYTGTQVPFIAPHIVSVSLSYVLSFLFHFMKDLECMRALLRLELCTLVAMNSLLNKAVNQHTHLSSSYLLLIQS